MLKEYEMSGACPIIVGGFGRVEPGSPPFTCEMEPAQEAFFTRIGAVRVLREVPDGALSAPEAPVDGEVEFEGRKLAGLPASWPRRGPSEGTVSDYEPGEV